MVLKDIVPWGRLKSEYIRMFDLTDIELNSRILGCGDGPSSFNSECTSNVTSIDPIYKYNKEEIKKRIEETSEIICKQLENNKSSFIWTDFKDVKELKEARLKAMKQFLEDYNLGKKEHRYIEGALPELKFEDDSFDLVVSSHFLFLYSDMLDLNFHKESIKEMLRVGAKIKIYPLCDLKGTESKHVPEILKWLDSENITNKLIKTDYEFQKGANSFLEILK